MIKGTPTTIATHSPYNVLPFISEIFEQYADLKTKGIFRVQPALLNGKNPVDELEKHLMPIIGMSRELRNESIKMLSRQYPKLFDSYVIANAIIRYYQFSFLFPLKRKEHLDYKSMANWYLFASKCKKIYTKSDSNTPQNISRAFNQAFIIFMGDLISQGHTETVNLIHKLLRLMQEVIKAQDNEMDDKAVAQVFSACFTGLLGLDQIIEKENKVKEWTFVAKVLLSLLRSYNFKQSPKFLYQQTENQADLIMANCIKIQTAFNDVPGLQEWGSNGTGQQRNKVLQFLFSPTLTELLSSNKNEAIDKAESPKITSSKKFSNSKRKASIPLLETKQLKQLHSVNDFNTPPSSSQSDSPLRLTPRVSTSIEENPRQKLYLNLGALHLKDSRSSQSEESESRPETPRNYGQTVKKH